MISVIIPTYNRQEKLQKTLKAFGEQTLSKNNFEIIVVEDGGNDGTQEFLKDFQKATELNLKYFYLDHRGPGVARNFGVEKSSFPIVLFCGDDTIPDENLLKIHCDRHGLKNNVAVLGIAFWDKSEEVTDFMRWLAPSGPQFHYNTIRNRDNAGFNHFYTCNISLEKKWLEQEKFDEQLDCAFEDIELGLRLEERGLKIVYDPKAKVFHSHRYDEKSFGERMKRVGRSAIIFFKKYEKDKKVLRMLKIKYAPFCYFPGMKTFHWLSKILANSRLFRQIKPKYSWFWEVCRDYSFGMIEESSRK